MKEVVHVPTRELAEKVLRVAKENGCNIDYTINEMVREISHSELCIRIFHGGGFGSIGFYEQDECKIITAQEFLDRYKPTFRPIAMKCTQEQFDAIKSKLVGCDVVSAVFFKDYPYLVNNANDIDFKITNTNNPLRVSRQVFEKWNEQIFLKYCGIEVKESELGQLRKENKYLKKHYNDVEQELKQINNKLSEELCLVKKQLQAIQDQPKIGDVCLFYVDAFNSSTLSKLKEIKDLEEYPYVDVDGNIYTYCTKATPENIQAKINELKNE